MANKKITQLTDLGSLVEGEDLLHIIDDPAGSPTNKKISLDSLFGNIPSLLNFKQTAQTITTSTTVDTGTVITYVDTGISALTLTLADGDVGQLKFIIQTAGTVGITGVVTPANFLGGSSLTFDAIGSCVILLFTGTTWVVVSNNGVTVA